MVATARHLDEARVRTLADGRAYTGGRRRRWAWSMRSAASPRQGAGWNRSAKCRPVCRSSDLKLGSLYERTVGATLAGLWPAALTQLLPQPGAWAIWRP